ncbi:MAG: LysM peptidoglycan-binding domain-containing protein [Clostridia bacterium]|nr:LysM peptidoglycan-binding domain-containing protein [Clostridia bacterium]
MNTSSKLRKLRRQQKLKAQRSKALLLMFVLMFIISTVVFSLSANSADKKGVKAITVKAGDTLWSIAKEHKPEGIDIAEYVYEISKNNGIDNSHIYVGQTVYVPDI